MKQARIKACAFLPIYNTMQKWGKNFERIVKWSCENEEKKVKRYIAYVTQVLAGNTDDDDNDEKKNDERVV